MRSVSEGGDTISTTPTTTPTPPSTSGSADSTLDAKGSQNANGALRSPTVSQTAVQAIILHTGIARPVSVLRESNGSAGGSGADMIVLEQIPVASSAPPNTPIADAVACPASMTPHEPEVVAAPVSSAVMACIDVATSCSAKPTVEIPATAIPKPLSTGISTLAGPGTIKKAIPLPGSSLGATLPTSTKQPNTGKITAATASTGLAANAGSILFAQHRGGIHNLILPFLMGNGSSTPPFLIPSAVPILGCAHFAPGPWGMGMNVAHLAGRTTAQYANGAPPKERDLLQKSSDDGKPTYIKPYPMADVIKPKAMAVPEVDSGKEGESPPLQSPPPRTEQPVQDLPPSSSTRSEKPEKTEKIVVELVPKNEVSERCVRESGFNPKIQLTTKLSKVSSLIPSLPPSKVIFNSAFNSSIFQQAISSLLLHLTKKWSKAVRFEPSFSPTSNP